MGGGFDHCVWLCPHFVWMASSERLSLLQSNLAWQCGSRVVMHRMGLLSLIGIWCQCAFTADVTDTDTNL